MKGKIVIDGERCKGCGYCIHFCPKEVIKKSGYLNNQGYFSAAQVDPEEKCAGCGICSIVCPEAAITVFREIPKEQKQEKEGDK